MTDSTLYTRKLHPIHEADILLGHDKRQQLLTEIKTLLNAPDDVFEEYCLPLIHGVAELLQELPSVTESRFDYPGGRLDFALERCSATLRVFEDYLKESNVADYVLAQPAVWRYTLLSLALLQHIGMLISHYEFLLFSDEQESIGMFSPFSGSMSAYGTFYQANYNRHGDNQERNTATLLLARQLMPDVGLNWINQFHEAFHFWALTLVGERMEQDGRSGGGPTQILTEALARILNRSLPREHLKQSKNRIFDTSENNAAKQSMASLIGGDDEDTRAAEAFLDDLEERLDFSEMAEDQKVSERADRIRVNSNRSSVHAIKKDALLIGFDVLQQWAQQNELNWQRVMKGLTHTNKVQSHYVNGQLSMGLGTARSISGFTIARMDSPMQISTALKLGLKPVANAAIQQLALQQSNMWPAKAMLNKPEPKQTQNNDPSPPNLFSSK